MTQSIIQTPDTREWALYYAKAFGWNVIPLYHATGFEQCSCGRLSCKQSSGKHPNVGTDWQNKATRDPQQIEAWWNESQLVAIAKTRAKKTKVERFSAINPKYLARKKS